MASNFWARYALLQVMIPTVPQYAANWHISLAYYNGDIWEAPRAEWELPNSRVPYTGGWIIDPAYVDNAYTQGVCSDTQLEIPILAAGRLEYWVLSNGLNEDQWFMYGQLSQTWTVAVGDTLRFPVGQLKVMLNN